MKVRYAVPFLLVAAASQPTLKPQSAPVPGALDRTIIPFVSPSDFQGENPVTLLLMLSPQERTRLEKSQRLLRLIESWKSPGLREAETAAVTWMDEFLNSERA